MKLPPCRLWKLDVLTQLKVEKQNDQAARVVHRGLAGQRSEARDVQRHGIVHPQSDPTRGPVRTLGAYADPARNEWLHQRMAG